MLSSGVTGSSCSSSPVEGVTVLNSIPDNVILPEYVFASCNQLSTKKYNNSVVIEVSYVISTIAVEPFSITTYVPSCSAPDTSTAVINAERLVKLFLLSLRSIRIFTVSSPLFVISTWKVLCPAATSFTHKHKLLHELPARLLYLIVTLSLLSVTAYTSVFPATSISLSLMVVYTFSGVGSSGLGSSGFGSSGFGSSGFGCSGVVPVELANLNSLNVKSALTVLEFPGSTKNNIPIGFPCVPLFSYSIVNVIVSPAFTVTNEPPQLVSVQAPSSPVEEADTLHASVFPTFLLP